MEEYISKHQLRDIDKSWDLYIFFFFVLKITANCRFFRIWSKGGIPLKTRNTCVFPQQLVYFYLKDLVNHVTDCISIFMLAASKFRARFLYPPLGEECDVSPLAIGPVQVAPESFWYNPKESLNVLILHMTRCSRLISKVHVKPHRLYFVYQISVLFITYYFYLRDMLLRSCLEQRRGMNEWWKFPDWGPSLWMVFALSLEVFSLHSFSAEPLLSGIGQSQGGEINWNQRDDAINFSGTDLEKREGGWKQILKISQFIYGLHASWVPRSSLS